MSRYRVIGTTIKIEAVQYGLREYADKPLVFVETPWWLLEAMIEHKIKSEFGGEDYWYLSVLTPKGAVQCGPDDWIIRTENGELGVREAKMFNDCYVLAGGETNA